MSTTTALTIGSRFEMDEALPYTVDGQKRTHTYTKECRVVAADEAGFTYDVVGVTNEQDRPDFAGTPKGGSVAWFALPFRVSKGTLRIGA
jgi:hypothetical protein